MTRGGRSAAAVVYKRQRQWLRDVAGAPVKRAMADEDLCHLRDLEGLLRDPSWHPAAIPMAAKRCIVTRNTRRVRRLRRWWLARMTGKTNQHDRHAGAPVDIHPVYDISDPTTPY